MARTIVYIDGFNLYYRALKGTRHKWLNLEALSRASLPAKQKIVRINYYTARVSGRIDPDGPRSQHAYLRAIATRPLVEIHYGRFLTNQKWAGLAPPVPSFKPDPTTLTIEPGPMVAKIWKTEEKGSDVNLAAHLVRDAFSNAFDEAAILTNDTDLCEPMRIVKDEVGLPITLLTPVDTPHKSLCDVATHVRHIGPYIGPCQFPSILVAANGKQIVKPADW
jgi:NYN domain